MEGGLKEERLHIPKVPKTTKGKVFPTIHSPMEPRIMRRPPKPRYTPSYVLSVMGPYDMCTSRDAANVPVEAAPLPPAPLQPMRSQDRGVRERRKPTRALVEEAG